MTQFDPSIDNLLRRKKDLENYAYIMERLRKVDISTDEMFQRKFNAFYRVRRNAAWRKDFYVLFEENKSNEGVTFASILRSIYSATGRIEASFSSKMLATLKPEMPIWDSIVLSKLHIKPDRNPDKQKRLDGTIGLYDEIVAWYEGLARLPEYKAAVRAFDSAFQMFTGFSDTKKIDFLIWGSGREDPFAGITLPKDIR